MLDQRKPDHSFNARISRIQAERDHAGDEKTALPKDSFPKRLFYGVLAAIGSFCAMAFLWLHVGAILWTETAAVGHNDKAMILAMAAAFFMMLFFWLK